ncbi:GAF domain-containing protein [Nocardia miyunensis]|uniref:GAF domain-containing protein n=1 Tax=Nocardia miyunensis TaxID=282684 RepID=UPI00083287FB|nr:GAF domain-containing protein [Nocardia miyunensis]
MTIEMLTPDAMSVASAGDAPRGFADWHRALQRALAKTPAVYDSFTTGRLAAAMQAVRDQAEDVDLRIPTRSGPHELKIRPVFGPAGDVHAIRFWLGPVTARVPDMRPAVGAIWDLNTQTVQLPSGIALFRGISAEEYAPRMSIAGLFHRMSGFDRHAEVLDLLYEPKPGDKLQFDATVLHASGEMGRWRVTIRARDDERTQGAWWLIEDVSSDGSPSRWATLERVGLREAHRRAGTHLAVVQLDYTSISHWLTDPAPWVRWDYLFRPIDVFHPDDRARLAELGDRLRAGETTGVTVRALNYTGGYTPTSLLVYPYPGYSSRQLAIAQLLRVADDVPVLEPQHHTLDTRHGSGPVGYDEQLRHWLAGRMNRSPA